MDGEPTLFLMVGLPGTGKTTLARRIETDHAALRLTKDEWVKALYGPRNPPQAGVVIEGRLIAIGLRALELGVNVVLDFGLWSRDERTALRHAAHERGAAVRVLWCDVTTEEQQRRLVQRQRENPASSWPMTARELLSWADAFQAPTPGELEDSERLDDPPAGFGSWDAWRHHRWYSSLP